MNISITTEVTTGNTEEFIKVGEMSGDFWDLLIEEGFMNDFPNSKFVPVTEITSITFNGVTLKGGGSVLIHKSFSKKFKQIKTKKKYSSISMITLKASESD